MRIPRHRRTEQVRSAEGLAASPINFGNPPRVAARKRTPEIDFVLMQLPRNRNRKTDCYCDARFEQAGNILTLKRHHHDAQRETGKDSGVGRAHDRRETSEETKEGPRRKSSPLSRFDRGCRHQCEHGANRDEQGRHVAHYQRRVRDEYRRQREHDRGNSRRRRPIEFQRNNEDGECRHDREHPRSDSEELKVPLPHTGNDFKEQRVAAGVSRRISISTEMQHHASPLLQVHCRRGVLQPIRPWHQFECSSRPLGAVDKKHQQQEHHHDKSIDTTQRTALRGNDGRLR